MSCLGIVTILRVQSYNLFSRYLCKNCRNNVEIYTYCYFLWINKKKQKKENLDRRGFCCNFAEKTILENDNNNDEKKIIHNSRKQ